MVLGMLIFQRKIIRSLTYLDPILAPASKLFLKQHTVPQWSLDVSWGQIFNSFSLKNFILNKGLDYEECKEHGCKFDS